MSFTDSMLDPPGYGYSRDGQLYVPTRGEVLCEFASRVNPLHRKNWLSVFAWATTLLLVCTGLVFLTEFFSWAFLVIALLYGAFAMGTHANFWVHRYCSHHAFRFRNSYVRMLCRNLVIRTVPEELHVISHHVHHKLSEQPGDPYNAHGGFLYCFLADVNHQGIRKDFSPEDYARVCRLLENTGVHPNSFPQYERWGSISHPAFAVGHYALNWAFWFAVFFALGGLPLALAIFGAAGFWALGYRTFNFEAHGGGKDLRREGSDFYRADFSVNLLVHGTLTGEWHNNHHLYPRSARAGFLPYQLDLPWLAIRFLHGLGIVTEYRDCRSLFLEKHWNSHQRSRAKVRGLAL